MIPNDSTCGQAGAVTAQQIIAYKSVSDGIFMRIAATLLLWHDRASQRRALGRLDEHLLMDIGVDRVTAKREAAKPFWRA